MLVFLPLGIECGGSKLLRAVLDQLDTLTQREIRFNVTQLR
ncbi:hypothetical protein [Bradyrhizobium valentinum]|nr:hypothetical protein [Bradyrhizobium valentinum]